MLFLRMPFLVFQLLICLLHPNLSNCEEDTRNVIISALEKATGFLENKFNEINLDALLGYRLMEGLERERVSLGAELSPCWPRKGSGKTCLVPDDCRRAMTRPQCSGYDLSHQLFYFMFAEMEGCSDPLFLNAQQYKNFFCAPMLQININAENQELLGTFGDLFTENSDQTQDFRQDFYDHVLELRRLLLCLLHPNLSNCEEDTRNVIISALEKATGFLESKFNEINLDALLGYRLMEVYLTGTLRKWNQDPRLASERIRLAHLGTKLAALTEKAKHAFEQTDPDYYRGFAPAFSPGFWKIPHQWTQTNSSLASQPNSDCPVMNLTDFCVSVLLGTWKGSGKPCLVPDDCRRAMTRPGCSGYDLSHQLFYFMFAEMQGCSDPLFLNAQYHKSVSCASMMQINNNAEKLMGSFGDLFTENILFCGMSGFSDFYKPQWLDLILSWQKPESGCFWMFGGCAAHNTGVAVGALAGFLYYGF
ncbi:hypothetical protein lerEdw1_018438 [Lerista edwardsae]|nr:hypothetical protein lerEdw1_018438 [Lerista edwardsae]